MADNDDYLDSIDNNHLDGTNGSLNMTDNSLGGGDEAAGGDVPDLAAIKARVREMEEEAEKLKQMQTEVDKQMSMGSPPGLTSPLNMSIEEKIEADNRSVYVGNVDYGATAEEVTILCNKFDGHPKGFAYIEFGDKDSVQTAMAMDESLFRGRQIKVMPKRTNKPGLSSTNRPPRGARGRGGGGRGFRGGFSPYYSGYRPARRGRGFRRGMYYSPY
ncbi:polyadenylate-binding protein 2 [Phthorimaea operculella]|nr:polyadenylate-binding protein 2 [Phthorimaea operculella]